MGRICKSILCGLMSVSFLFTNCVSIFAEEQVEEINDVTEDETNDFVQNIDIISDSNQVTITFLLREEVDDASISITGTNNTTINHPTIENSSIIFTTNLPQGSYTIESLKINNPDELEIDLSSYETNFTIEEDVDASNESNSFTPRLSAPDSSNPYYYDTSYNPYDPSDSCTWYAFGRAYEILETCPNLPNDDASNWFMDNYKSKAYKKGSTPKVGSIICWSGQGGNSGYVAVVEEVNDDNTITISESGYDNKTFNTRTIGSDGSCSETENGELSFQGYIYVYDGTSSSSQSSSSSQNTETQTGSDESSTDTKDTQTSDSTTEKSFTSRLSAPDSSNPYYYDTNYNDFYYDSDGNCTWYAFGRAYEILGTRPDLPNDYASNWYNDNLSSKSYTFGSTPKVGAIACWTGLGESGLYLGHVAVVEAINDDNTITISESGYNSKIFNTRTISSDGSCWTTENGVQSFQGYIYIYDETSSQTSTDSSDQNSGTQTDDTTGKDTDEKTSGFVKEDETDTEDSSTDSKDTQKSDSSTEISFTPRYSAPDYSNPYYYNSDYNPLYYGYTMANCAWYAYGRAYEILGTSPNLPNDFAGNWYSYNYTNGYYKYGSTAKVGAIACWAGTYNFYLGHVAVVEAVNGDKMTISESNYDGNIYSYREINSDGSCYTTQHGDQIFLGFIYITEPIIPVTGISLSTNSLTLQEGESSSLTAAISPSNATVGTDLVWSSSDESVATVDQNGNVQAISEGSATISVSSKDYSNVKSTCSVTVKGITKINGYDLTIDGKIGLNFYFNLSSTLKSQDNAYIRFSINNDEAVTKVYVKDAKKTDYGYEFSYTVSPKDISGTITAQAIDENGNCEKSLTYSVENYIEDFMENYSESHVYYNLARSLLTYGYYAENYFDYRKDIPTDYLNEVSIPDLSSYKYVLESKQDNLHFVGARLILTSKPGLKLYFTGNESLTVDCVGNVDQETISFSNEGKYQVVSIADIDDMSKMFTIDSDSIHLEYGIYSYGKIALNGNNESLKNLICAMVDYNTEYMNLSDSK